MKVCSSKKQVALTLAVLSAVCCSSTIIEAAGSNNDTLDVVVTASRTEQGVKETPTAVELITRQDIENMGAESLSQALRLATGINIMPHATPYGKANAMVGQQISLRGMKGNQTLILIDGRRIRTEETDEVTNVYELHRMDVNDIERIEIVRGAVSSLYGADAMGGVINIITRKAKERAVVTTSDWTTKEYNKGIRYASGQQGKWNFSVGYKYSKIKQHNTLTSESGVTKGAAKLPNLLVPGQMVDYWKVANSSTNASNMFGNRHYVNLRAEYDVSKDKKLDIFVNYMKESLKSTDTASGANTYVFGSYPTGVVVMTPMHGPLNGGVPAASFTVGGGTVTTKDVDYDNQRYGGGATYTGKDKRGDYKLSYSYELLKKEQKTLTNNVLTDKDTMKFSQHIVEAQRTVRANDMHKLTYGAEYRNQGADSTRMSGSGVAPSKPSVNKSTNYFAAYVEDEVMPSDNWLMVPSLRYDYNDRFGSKVTYKLGNTYMVDDSFRVKLNTGTSYRAPSLSEMYMDFTMNPTGGINIHVVGNENLKPEVAWTSDLGFEKELGKSQFKVTGFYTRVRDLINGNNVEDYPSHYTSVYENIDRATISGMELEWKQKLDSKWNVRTLYNYIDAMDDNTHQRLRNRTMHNTSLQLQYAFAPQGWTATIWNDWYTGYKYQAADSDVSLSGSSLNFVVTKKIGKKHNVYFGVDNIMNSTKVPMGLTGRVWRFGYSSKF